jgi:hypothetical protein
MILGLFMVKPTVSSADSNLLFILDGSNSMWGQVDGVAKIVTAKDVLSKLLIDLPPGTKPGLMAYGHRTADCTDVELLSSFGSDSTEVLTKKLNTITPRGKTPIGYSLLKSGRLLERYKDQNNFVVLVSDGIETCGGDPCKTAAELIKAGIDVRVHVVGFDVNKDERGQLECIADAGNGRYFHASSTKGLKEAVAEVKKEVQVAQVKPKPKPKKAEPKKYFFDEFDGDELKDHWEVVNPDPDSFIIEDGNLLVVNSKPAVLSEENVPNLFRLAKSMPKGDWVMTAKFIIDFQTENEKIVLGLYNNKKNYIMARISAPEMWNYVAQLNAEAVKASKGEITRFERAAFNGGKNNPSYAEAVKAIPQPILLRLRKQGRSYFAGVKLEGVEKPKWQELEKLTSLRAKGNLALGLYQAKKVTGETTIKVDWVKIETLE